MFNPLIPRISDVEVTTSHVYTRSPYSSQSVKVFLFFFKDAIHEKAKQLIEKMKQSMEIDEKTFGVTQLNEFKLVANELECHTCKHIMRYIFQESMEIERYPQVFRERFDIAFSQAVIITLNINTYLFKLEYYFCIQILYYCFSFCS